MCLPDRRTYTLLFRRSLNGWILFELFAALSGYNIEVSQEFLEGSVRWILRQQPTTVPKSQPLSVIPILVAFTHLLLLVLSREYGNILCRDYVGIIFPYSLRRTRKFLVRLSATFMAGSVGLSRQKLTQNP